VVVALAAVAALGVVLAAGGCSGVLGMDAPTLDPCLQGGCLDVGVEAPVGTDGNSTADGSDTGSDGNGPVDGPGGDDADASGGGDGPPACLEASLPDASPGGIRCGGGCYPVTYCTGTSVCCQTTDDAGVPKYACMASETACSNATGYTIKCENENDCGGNDVCCHFSTHMVCDSDPTCVGSTIACVPGSSSDCPTGKKCDVVLVNANVSSPYWGCAP